MVSLYTTSSAINGYYTNQVETNLVQLLGKCVTKQGINIDLTSEIDTESGLDLTLEAKNNDRLYGDVKLANYGGETAYLTGLYTNKVDANERIKNLGTVLLHQAALIAKEYNIKTLETAATMSHGETHPAQFYNKFGFRVNTDRHKDFNEGDGIENFVKKRLNNTVNMVADIDDILKNTQEYLKENKWDESTLNGVFNPIDPAHQQDNAVHTW